MKKHQFLSRSFSYLLFSVIFISHTTLWSTPNNKSFSVFSGTLNPTFAIINHPILETPSNDSMDGDSTRSEKESFSVGISYKSYGIRVGNCKRLTGIRINFRDRNVEKVNGINFTIWKPAQNPVAVINGIALGIWSPKAKELNGISLGMHVSGKHVKGLSIGVLGVESEESSCGIMIGGLGVGSGGDMKGIIVGGLGAGSGGDMRGIVLGGLGTGCGGELAGIAIGGLGLGSGDDMKGLMFGTLGLGAGKNLSGIAIGGLGAGCGNDMHGLMYGTVGIGVGKNANGIIIGGLGVGIGDTAKGITIGGLAVSAGKQLQGINLSLGAIAAGDNLQGLMIAPLSVTSGKSLKGLSFAAQVGSKKQISGIAVGLYLGGAIGRFKEKNTIHYSFRTEEFTGLGLAGVTNAKYVKGITIALFNRTNRLNGIQIGILNYAGNNPKFLKLLPIVNAHL